MELWIGALNLGFLYAFLALGTYITYKVYNFPDITVDGSFTTGAAVASVLIIEGINPFLAVLVSFAAGACAGFLTGFIHTKFKINGLLAGILVMTGLYSINLRIMGKSNIPLLNSPGFVTIFEEYNPGINHELWILILIFLMMTIIWLLLSRFFQTDLGVTMRATGDNPVMVSASGINTDKMKIFGIAMANGFVGLSGGFVAQYQGFSDIGMGVGAVVTSLAAVIIGEAIIRHRSIFLKILSVIIGSLIFRLMVALALLVGLDPNDLKLITAVFVLFTLIASGAFGGEKKRLNFPLKFNLSKNQRRIITSLSAAVIVVIALVLIYKYSFQSNVQKKLTIGIVIPNDSDILIKTRDGFLSEIERIGYKIGEDITIIEKNANGDIPTVSTIVDNFINQGVDIFLPISTASTQAVMNKVKDKPVIFATVADPFIIGVGENNYDHPPNVTGIYGTMPIKELLDVVTKIYNRKQKLGAIWNPSFPNSVHNVKVLQDAIAESGMAVLEGATITNSSEVYQAAQSLIARKIDIFFLIPDITVYAAFESIVKASRANKVPIFTGDVERLQDGALAVYGYEYFVSGMQAAHLVDRVIKGENIASIPFENYKAVTVGLNYDIISEFGISIPDEIKAMSNSKVENGKFYKNEIDPSIFATPSVKRRVALFQFTDNALLNETAEGVQSYIVKNNFDKKYNLIIDNKNAQGDFATAQSIASEIVAKKYDYVVTVSTVAMQAVANGNKKIPHIFAAVTDPLKSGVAKTFSEHQPNLTGLATPQPVESTLKLMREILPNAKRIGMLWNPAEANSEICTNMAREAAKKYGFELKERIVTNTNEIEEALKSVIVDGVDIFFTSGDVTVSMAVPSIAATLLKKGIPYFTNTPADIKDNVFICLGADYFEVGEEAAKILERVIKGEKTVDIPIQLFVPENLSINLKIARGLNINIPEKIISTASKVVR